MKSDRQLQSDVVEELSWEPATHSERIGVEVKEGIVTLTGHVDSYAEKVDAERAAMCVSGVNALAIGIDVGLMGSSTRHDVDIARAVDNVLQWTTYLPRDAAKIKVEGGWVTLSGEVNWEYQRQAAVDAVRYLTGVKGVNDENLIKPKTSVLLVKAEIEAALKRRVPKEASEITVSVDGSHVMLSGNVHSWSDREAARHTAWGSPGVSRVIDNMTMV